VSPKSFLGEFEQMVLLAILQEDDEAFALEVRREIERSADRRVSRGAFYTTLERLERKGMVSWEEESPDDARRSGPLRRFSVTREGLEALRESRKALEALSRGLDDMLGHVG
jgi:PadR family transcriptional regulator